jgi:uncharacterized protein YcbK (DUF882 family)
MTDEGDGTPGQDRQFRSRRLDLRVLVRLTTQREIGSRRFRGGRRFPRMSREGVDAMGMNRRAVLRRGLRYRDFNRSSSGVRSSGCFGTNARLRQRAYGRTLEATYWEGGAYQSDALAAIDRILRDHRTDETTEMDTGLLDLLHSLRATLGSRRRYEVFSGYRSPSTNAALFEEGHGVAEHSFQMAGTAIDIRLPDRSGSVLRRAALPTPSWRCRVLSAFGFRSRRRGTAAPLVAAREPRCARIPPRRARARVAPRSTRRSFRSSWRA